MKDIPIEELAEICPAIHAAATRIGCTNARISSPIWPGGHLSGETDDAIRVIEYSWFNAAVLKGEAIFQDDDPKRFAALLHAYGLGDELPDTCPSGSANQPIAPDFTPPPLPEKVRFSVEVLETTKRELERQAAEAGLPVAEFLDRTFSGAA